MKTEEAILKIAEVLDVLVGNFNPDCGGDFEQGSYCKGCEFYHQCKQGTEAREINSRLQSLIAEGSKAVYDLETAYTNGFHDAERGYGKHNPGGGDRTM